MIRRLVRICAIVLVFLAPRTAIAQLSFVVMGGLSAPVSVLSDFSNTGYNIAGGLNVGMPVLPVGARFEAGYNSFGYKAGGGNTSIITATANAVGTLGIASNSPYIIGGLGFYNRRFSASNTGYEDSRTTVGLNIGGGLRFPLTGVTSFFEVRYNVMFGNGEDATNYQFIPITFGISF